MVRVAVPKRGIPRSVQYLADEGEISVVDEARRSPASLPWCAVSPVADDLEKEGTTKEARAKKGVLAKYKQDGCQSHLDCSSAADRFEYENPLRRWNGRVNRKDDSSDVFL